MNCLRKVIPYQELSTWRLGFDPANGPLIVTNGCFDLLHTGHLFLLEQARSLGGSLLVGVTGDEAVRKLKGTNRPAIPERDRLLMLAGLESVSNVCLFPEPDAVGFLELARPDIYVKGGDYTLETIHQGERKLLEEMKVNIRFLRVMKERSTSKLLQEILARSS